MKKIALLTLASLFFACSSDGTTEAETNNQNGFTFDGTFYEIKTVYVNDENVEDDTPSEIGINLINKTAAEMNGSNDLSNVNSLYFDFDDVTVQQTTYSDMTDYRGYLNRSRISGTMNAGTQILSDSEADPNLQTSSNSVTINSFTATTIDLTFSFTRTDGKVVSGQYSGPYLMP